MLRKIILLLTMVLFGALSCADNWQPNDLKSPGRNLTASDGSSAGDWTLHHHQTFSEAESLENVWASSGSDVFAVGYVGTSLYESTGVIMHYDGNSWSSMDLPDDKGRLMNVWGTSGSDVFAVGHWGHILHYDGASWSLMDNPESGGWSFLQAIGGTSGSNVFTSATGPLHYDGNIWAYEGNPHLRFSDIHNVSDSDLYGICNVSGSEGQYLAVHHYDGNSWSTPHQIPGVNGVNVWGSSDSDIYIVGTSGSSYRLLHYDGSEWTPVELPDSPSNLINVWGTSSSNVFVSGYNGQVGSSQVFHFNGTSWNEISLPSSTDPIIIYGVWCNDTDLVVSGMTINSPNKGAILHYKRPIITAKLTEERAYFDFDGNFEDSSRRSYGMNHGENNGVALFDYRGGKAGRFDGTNFVSIESDELRTGVKDLTISAWVKLDADMGTEGMCYGVLSNETYQNSGYLLRVENRDRSVYGEEWGRIHFRTNVSGKATYITTVSRSYPDDKEWHHIAVVKNGTTGRIYLDGKELSLLENMPLLDPVDASGSTCIGGNAQWLQRWKGSLDEVKFFDRPISHHDVYNEYSRLINNYDSPIPDGWVKTGPNTMTYVVGYPKGTFMQVEADSPLPEGWARTGPNTMTYVVGYPKGTFMQVEASSPLPEGWARTGPNTMTYVVGYPKGTFMQVEASSSLPEGWARTGPNTMTYVVGYPKGTFMQVEASSSLPEGWAR
ncbi:MAG: hypothetical protein GY754_24270, partial [bacterium]|nr:hypothetical protein [bacterium]